jgi:hypothetical protein
MTTGSATPDTQAQEYPTTTAVASAAPTSSLHEALSGREDGSSPRPAPLPQSQSRPQSQSQTTEIVAIDCPGCGVRYVGPRPSRSSARSFCTSCDYPLFLAIAPAPPPEGESDLGKRRAPGVDGKDRLGAMPCPECSEPNMPDPNGSCLRCGAVLFPEPIPEPESAPLPEVDVVVVYRSNYWWVIATATLSILLAATAAALYWIW